jgi:hypothetical protein
VVSASEVSKILTKPFSGNNVGDSFKIQIHFLQKFSRVGTFQDQTSWRQMWDINLAMFGGACVMQLSYAREVIDMGARWLIGNG